MTYIGVALSLDRNALRRRARISRTARFSTREPHPGHDHRFRNAGLPLDFQKRYKRVFDNFRYVGTKKARVLLVDDVITTGATASAYAARLAAVGGTVAVMRTPRESNDREAFLCAQSRPPQLVEVARRLRRRSSRCRSVAVAKSEPVPCRFDQRGDPFAHADATVPASST